MPETITYRGEVFDVPDMDQLDEWAFDSVCEALDGCEVEPDGRCPDGYPSWLIALGIM